MHKISQKHLLYTSRTLHTSPTTTDHHCLTLQYIVPTTSQQDLLTKRRSKEISKGKLKHDHMLLKAYIYTKQMTQRRNDDTNLKKTSRRLFLVAIKPATTAISTSWEAFFHCFPIIVVIIIWHIGPDIIRDQGEAVDLRMREECRIQLLCLLPLQIAQTSRV